MPHSIYPDRKMIAEMTAKALLEINAIKFSNDKPYIFSSGLASPVYIDCRRLISHPYLRMTLMDFMAATVARDIGVKNLDSIAGGETAGIPFGAWLADKLLKPMQYVRKKPKGFGPNAQIEGEIREGERVLLVEDLTTDGVSKMNFCKALRKAGAVADHTIMIFYYDIFPETRTMLEKNGISLHYLATWRDILKVGKDMQYFDDKTFAEIEKFLDEPLRWSTLHGGATEINL